MKQSLAYQHTYPLGRLEARGTNFFYRFNSNEGLIEIFSQNFTNTPLYLIDCPENLNVDIKTFFEIFDKASQIKKVQEKIVAQQ